MAPEYNKVYIPYEHVAKFEAFVGDLQGADLGKKKSSRKDFPSTAEELGIGELAQRAKSTIDQLPPQTRLRDLRYWRFPEAFRRRNDVDCPQPWLEFMYSIDTGSRKLVARTINGLYFQLPRERRAVGPTIEELKSINWTSAQKPNNVGQKGMAFLAIAFSK